MRFHRTNTSLRNTFFRGLQAMHVGFANQRSLSGIAVIRDLGFPAPPIFKCVSDLRRF